MEGRYVLTGEAKTAGIESLRVEYWLADTQSTIGTSGGEVLRDWFDYLLLHPFGVHNVGGSAGSAWEVVDTQVGIPDSLKGASPVEVMGHYAVYRLP